jgi:hypothetical protein
MVAPVTGPFVKFPTFPFADAYQRGYRQKMPIDRPLEYRMYWNYGTRQQVSWFTNGSVDYGIATKQADFNLASDPSYASLRQHAYNKAYEKMRAKAMDTAGWAENLAQINKTRRTLVERSVQLAHFAGAVKQRRFTDAARILRTPLPSNVSHRKAASQNFLEYEYGVKPLVSDIVESCNILTGDPFEKQVRGRASERILRLTTVGGVVSGNPFYTYRQRKATQGTLTVTCRATFRVTSPNLLLANQLGLIDLALPWKLIPGSFIVDWFVNIEQVISSLTDWYGAELLHPHVTDFAIGQYEETYWQNAVYQHGVSEGFRTSYDKESVEMNRTMGLPGPSLVVKPFKGFSVSRGAQAIALVLSVLGK